MSSIINKTKELQSLKSTASSAVVLQGTETNAKVHQVVDELGTRNAYDGPFVSSFRWVIRSGKHFLFQAGTYWKKNLLVSTLLVSGIVSICVAGMGAFIAGYHYNKGWRGAKRGALLGFAPIALGSTLFLLALKLDPVAIGIGGFSLLTWGPSFKNLRDTYNKVT
jgi:hypothetical protein